MAARCTVPAMTDDDATEIERADAKKAQERSTSRWAIGIVLVVLAVCGLCAWRVNAKNEAPVDPSGDAKRVCQEEFVPKRLKAPKTAEFTGVTVSESDGVYTVTGSVDAQNSFGALIRSTFTCKVRETGDNWVLDSATVS